MADERNDRQQNNEAPPSPAPPSDVQQTREVVVTHLDSPPPLGKERVDPRRPAPIVPTREQRISRGSVGDSKSDKSSRE